MANEQKEKSPEELQKEAEEKASKTAEVANKNLKSSMWDYAAPKLITHEDYGKLADDSEVFYNQAISKTPEQSIYEQIFLPQLQSEGGAITSPYIQSTSAMILQESLASIKIEDALKYGGNKGPVRADWAGKYVNQLDKKVAGAIIVSAIQYQTGETVKKVLSSRQERISKGLEELVKEPEKTEPGK